jgi:hypothetical protein
MGGLWHLVIRTLQDNTDLKEGTCVVAGVVVMVIVILLYTYPNWRGTDGDK